MSMMVGDVAAGRAVSRSRLLGCAFLMAGVALVGCS
jgi:hypothetical protein